MQPEEGTGWLLELLSEVQLQQYFLRLRDDLNVTRLSHFEYVKNEDLEKIGMGRPGRWGHRCPTDQLPCLSSELPASWKSPPFCVPWSGRAESSHCLSKIRAPHLPRLGRGASVDAVHDECPAVKVNCTWKNLA